MDIARLILGVDSSQVRSATKDVEHLHKSGSKAESAFKGLGGVLTKLGVGAAIGAVLHSVIRNTIEAEQATAQLEARIRSTGGVSGMTMGALTGLAESLAKVTTFSDEAIMASEALMLTFTKIGKDVFPAAQEAALNMSIALGTDLQSATLQLGKALNDPILGITALSRAGVQFSTDQKAVIKALVETNRIAEAQKIILAELETQMGGAARAARNTLGGAIQNLKNQFGELLEGDSGSDGVRGATAAVNEFADTLASAKTQGAISTFIAALFKIASALTYVVEGFTYAGKRIGMDLANLAIQAGNVKEILDQVGTYGRKEGTIGEARARMSEQFRRHRQEISDLDLEATGLTRDQITPSYKLPSWAGGQSATPTSNTWRMPGEFTPKPVDTSDLDLDPPKPKRGGGGGSKASDGAKAAADAAAELEALRKQLATEEELIDASYAERTTIIAKHRDISEAERTKLSERSKAMYDKEREELRLSKGRELEDLRLSMRTQEEVIAETYANRMELLRKNTEEGSALRIKLEAAVTAERDKELAAYQQSIADRLAYAAQGLLTEEEELYISFERKKQIILEATEGNELARQELLRRLQESFAQEELAREQELMQAKLSIQAGMFGAMSDLAAAFAQGSGKNAKKMFEISKALSIAETIISTYQAAQNAYQDALAKHMGMPYAVMSAAMAVVAGLARVMRIRNTKFSGNFDEGGQIPAGKYGIVGERGPEYVMHGSTKAVPATELSVMATDNREQGSQIPAGAYDIVGERGPEYVRGPATVIGREQTAKIMEREAERGSVTNVTNIDEHPRFSGMYDLGGKIPAGKFGIVGERGPEFVRGPAMVTSRQETARQMSRGGGNVITLNSTFNITGTSTTQETSGDRENTAREFKRLVDARFHDLVNQEQRAGGSLWRMMR